MKWLDLDAPLGKAPTRCGEGQLTRRGRPVIQAGWNGHRGKLRDFPVKRLDGDAPMGEAPTHCNQEQLPRRGRPVIQAG